MRRVAATHHLTTARFALRPWSDDDVDALHALLTTPGVRRFLLDDAVVARAWVAEAVAQSEADFRARGCGLWSVWWRDDTPGLVGFAGFRDFFTPPETQLIYGVAPSLWGRGIATELARTLIGHALTCGGFARVVAVADAPNLASLRVMEKAGMRFLKRTVRDGAAVVYYAATKAADDPVLPEDGEHQAGQGADE